MFWRTLEVRYGFMQRRYTGACNRMTFCGMLWTVNTNIPPPFGSWLTIHVFLLLVQLTRWLAWVSFFFFSGVLESVPRFGSHCACHPFPKKWGPRSTLDTPCHTSVPTGKHALVMVPCVVSSTIYLFKLFSFAFRNSPHTFPHSGISVSISVYK